MTTPDDPTTRISQTGWPSELPAEPAQPVEQPAAAPEATESVAEPVAESAPAVSEAPLDTAPLAELPDAQLAEASGVGPRSALRSTPILALVLTTLLMAVAAGFVWFKVHQHDATESARRAALEASRDASRVLFSYDYRELSKDFAAGKAVTTGAFRNQYADTTAKVVTPVATQKKAVVKAEVVSAGVVRASQSTVVTVVFVNQVTTSSLQAGPKVDLSRVRMTLQHVGGRWLVSKVEAL